MQSGEQVPDFTLPDASGNPIQLADYRGKRVVLYFYPKDNTPACTQEACDFRDSKEAFDLLDTVIIGISTDPVGSHSRFVAKHGLLFVLLSDEEHKVAEQYGVWQLKQNYGKTYMGIVRSTFLIDRDGTLIREWSKVRVKGHVEEALTYLKEAGKD